MSSSGLKGLVRSASQQARDTPPAKQPSLLSQVLRPGESMEETAERKTVASAITRTYSSDQHINPEDAHIATQQAKWEKAGQGHVFKFFNGLSDEKKKIFINQVSDIEVENLAEFRQHALDTEADMKDSVNAELLALPSVSLADSSEEERNRWSSLGRKLISEGKVGVLVLAGGQGSRLGSTDPKGMYDIGLPSHKSLFQVQGEKIRKLQLLIGKEFNKESVVIPWYVMTSPATHEPTVNFFQKHDNFGLNKDNILFFQQGVLPAMTPEGQVLMESKSRVFVAPDGNGGLYRALKSKGILDDMHKRGVEYVAQYCVDNILSKVGDPTFIGFTAERQAHVACKSVKKVDPDEKVGLLVSRNGKPGVAEYSEISSELTKKKDSNGDLFLRAGHICINCFSVDFLNKAASEYKTKFHIARKKIPTIDENGKKFTPPKENGWKLEQFIFDPFEYVKEVVVFEVPREQEFSALKNPPGTKTDSPDSSRQDLSNLHKGWLNKRGAVIKGDATALCEISPLYSYDGEGLEAVKEKEYDLPLYLQ